MTPYYALNDQQEQKVRCCHCEGELLETQLRRVYKESPVQRIVINIECLHQAINISASNKALFHFKELN